MRARRWIAVAIGIGVFWGGMACNRAAPPPEQATPVLLGNIKPVVSVKELMKYMIDPISDNIFDAVWWEATSKAATGHRPTTDDDWEKVKTGAVTIAEGIYLLKVPRPFAPAG